MKYLLASLLLITTFAFGQPAETSVSIIPKPLNLKVNTGSFTLPNTITVLAKSPDEINVSNFIKEWLSAYGRMVDVINTGDATITLTTIQTLRATEGYQLNVNDAGIRISAGSGAGLFYGVQSLMQLLPPDKTATAIPFVEIADEPKFGWRGSMLDVARHFFPITFIKKYLDLLAFYKINTFHWHLTDDQGWRIEIKKYPKLTQVGAFRKETLIGEEQLIKKAGGNYIYDGIPYGGFYTQDEIKDVIEYAKARYITIVPEIEMPGHTLSVLAAYPELACKPGTYEVFTKWGVSSDIICPSEASFKFFEDVLTEVTQLFPGKYVHIGGDEAPKTVWKESEDVKKIMAKNKIKDVEKVQGWFNARIEKFLISKGKKLIGWDEILEGGITPASTIMSWRGEQGGIEAAQHGNDVVMAPHNYVYLDYGQNPQPHAPLEPIMICCYLPIERIYSYDPLSEAIAPEMHKHILGVQANLWTEYITTPAKAEYALFPRILALSEIAWTDPKKKDVRQFKSRVSQHYAMLDWKNVNYRIPEPLGLTESDIKKTDTHATINLISDVPGSKIVFTLDGHLPDETASVYEKPIVIPLGRNIKVSAVTIAPNHRKSAPVELVIK
jgi:hexosaminidase